MDKRHPPSTPCPLILPFPYILHVLVHCTHTLTTVPLGAPVHFLTSCNHQPRNERFRFPSSPGDPAPGAAADDAPVLSSEQFWGPDGGERARDGAATRGPPLVLVSRRPAGGGGAGTVGPGHAVAALAQLPSAALLEPQAFDEAAFQGEPGAYVDPAGEVRARGGHVMRWRRGGAGEMCVVVMLFFFFSFSFFFFFFFFFSPFLYKLFSSHTPQHIPHTPSAPLPPVPFSESNARMVEWSDGTRSLYIGNEPFSCSAGGGGAKDNMYLFLAAGGGSSMSELGRVESKLLFAQQTAGKTYVGNFLLAKGNSCHFYFPMPVNFSSSSLLFYFIKKTIFF
jgi:hypothetical protein